MKRIVENGQAYIIRQGQRIAVIPADMPEPPKRKTRKVFEPEWVKLPLPWIKVLRQCKSMATLHLAHIILVEATKRQYVGGEVVLSSQMTQMQRDTRRRAMKELMKLGLIELHRSSGNQAFRCRVNYYS